jgi:hypothetical protein
MKQGLMIVVLTAVAVLSMKEHVVNVPEPYWMYTAPPSCLKIKENQRNKSKRIVETRNMMFIRK